MSYWTGRPTQDQLYRDAGVMLRDEGGVIVPMFNDYIDATNDKSRRLG